MANKFLTSEQRQELLRELRLEDKAKYSDRIKTIILLDDGETYANIAKFLFLDEGTIANYRRRYKEGGAACSFTNGATRACNTQVCDIDCIGSWGACTSKNVCGEGSETFQVQIAAQGNGAKCAATSGATRVCNIRKCNCERTYKYITPDWKTYHHLCPKLPPSTIFKNTGGLKFKSSV